MSQISPEQLYVLSDVAKPIYLSKVRNYKDTSTELWTTNFGNLINTLYPRPDYSPTKEGAGFLIGPTSDGRRSNASMMYGCVGVIDADSSLGEGGKVISGAPDLEEVHQALKGFNLNHFIYSTYSHGSGKGNRYRIVLPMTSRNKIELLAGLNKVAELLQMNARIPLALTRESHTWAQMWQLPRVSGPDAPFEFRYHVGGYEINTIAAAIHAKLYDEHGQPIGCTVPDPLKIAKQFGEDEDEDDDDSRPSIIKLFNRTISALDVIGAAGYTFNSQHTIVDQNGEASLVYRYKKPMDTGSDAGVIVFIDTNTKMNNGEYNYRVFSHHTTDPLCNGHSNDAFACLMMMNGSSVQATLAAATKMIQAEANSHLAEQYPSLSDKTFRIMNRCFAGSKVYYNQLDWHAFMMKTINQAPVPTIERNAQGDKYVKFIPVPDYWKQSKARITYEDLVFAPYPADQENGIHFEDNGTLKFNTFNGWAEKPRKGEWPLLQQHLFHTICGGVQKEYEYLLDWFSHLYTKPNEKPGVSIVLRGGKGWGKSSVFHRIAQAVGYNATVLSHSEQLVGKFNAHIRDSLLIIAEEAFFHGNKRDASALKHLITDRDTMVEAKGKDAKKAESVCRVIMVTNEDLVVEATGDERRFFVPTITDWSYRKDIVDGQKGHFFPQLFAEMDNGGLAAFMYDMIQRKATMTKVVNVPNTYGLAYQRVQSLTGTMSWLFRALRDAHFETEDKIFNWTTTGLRVKEKDLIKSIKPELSPHERGRNYLFNIMSQLKRTLGTNLHTAAGYVTFGPVEMCRKAFLERSLVPEDSFDDAAHPLENMIKDHDNVVGIR